MGDKSRFMVFADFIARTFPNARAIADVGGGRGTLTMELTKRGLHSTVIDPRQPPHFPRRLRKQWRKEHLRTGRPIPRVDRVVAQIEEVDLAPFDLIVGLHPDEASELIVRMAAGCGKAFAVVPCCVMPLDEISRPIEEWIRYLAGLAPRSHIEPLPMEGRNLVVFREAVLLEEGKSPWAKLGSHSTEGETSDGQYQEERRTREE